MFHYNGTSEMAEIIKGQLLAKPEIVLKIQLELVETRDQNANVISVNKRGAKTQWPVTLGIMLTSYYFLYIHPGDVCEFGPTTPIKSKLPLICP